MIKRLLIVCMAFVLMSFNEVVTAVISAFEKADANTISSFFDNTVGIKPPGEFEFKIQPRGKATSWINTFYVEKNITGFEQTKVNDIDGYTLIISRFLIIRYIIIWFKKYLFFSLTYILIIYISSI